MPTPGHSTPREWPAQWIADARPESHTPRVVVYRRQLSLEVDTHLRIHVSADEQYDLFVDGRCIGRGPERGDRSNWFFDSYDLVFPAGTHTIVARVWWLGAVGPSPLAQHSYRHGFVLAAEDAAPELLNTGVADWQCKPLPGYSWLPHGVAWGCGAKVRIDGTAYDWNYLAEGDTDRWHSAVKISPAMHTASANPGDVYSGWMLRPALLPAMLHRPVTGIVSRFVAAVSSDATDDAMRAVAVHAADHIQSEGTAWSQLVSSGVPVSIPAHTRRRVLLDVHNYVCAYPQLITTGGAGAHILINWAEGLYLDPVDTGVWPGGSPKGHRDEIEGKYFRGVGDEFLPDGGSRRVFETLWWEAGRYIEIVVSTAEQPLTIEAFHLLETRFPYQFKSHFDAPVPRLGDVTRLAFRALEMCSHDSHMDCPYYEQLQYVGDTRLQALVAYTTTLDNGLQRKALEMFNASRLPNGLTQSRYPSRNAQVIPPFSLWWVGMVHDYLYWRGQPSLVRRLLPGVRGVLDAYASHLNADGLLGNVAGWNYVDWVPGWDSGSPPGGKHGACSVIAWQYILALKLASEVEAQVGELELAALQLRRAKTLATNTLAAFWDESRGMLADDLEHKHFSEHGQCLALLSGLVPPTHAPQIAAGLLGAPDLARATIYFSHYLFEAYYLLSRTDRMLESLSLWQNLADLGLHTTIETPEPTRSDCHGWGAHPLYHFHASVLGIRPDSVGFGTVRIAPGLGTLSWARGTTVHPKGLIVTDFSRRADGRLDACISLPKGLTGVFDDGEISYDLVPGTQTFGEVPQSLAAHNLGQVK